MARTNAKKVAICKRRERAASLYMRGQTQAAIAEALGVDPGTVSRDLAILQAEWQLRATTDTEMKRAEELAKLRLVQSEAWQEYERSKGPHEVSSGERIEIASTNPPVVKTRTSFRRETRCGDARYLWVIIRATEREHRLLGLDPPARSEIDARFTTSKPCTSIEVVHESPHTELLGRASKALANLLAEGRLDGDDRLVAEQLIKANAEAESLRDSSSDPDGC